MTFGAPARRRSGRIGGKVPVGDFLSQPIVAMGARSGLGNVARCAWSVDDTGAARSVRHRSHLWRGRSNRCNWSLLIAGKWPLPGGLLDVDVGVRDARVAIECVPHEDWHHDAVQLGVA